jgi:hypothetical protein
LMKPQATGPCRKATQAPLSSPQNHQKFPHLDSSLFFLSMNNANFNILGTSSNAIYEVPGCVRAVRLVAHDPNRRFSNRMEKDGGLPALDLGCGSSLSSLWEGPQ